MSGNETLQHNGMHMHMFKIFNCIFYVVNCWYRLNGLD